MDISDISKGLESFVTFVHSLSRYSDDVLTKQMNGSWSIRDTISHIMGWDINFTNTIVNKMINNEPVMLAEHSDVQGINDESVAYGRTMKPHDLLNEAISIRGQLISQLNLISKSSFSKQFDHNASYTLESFIQEMFIGHDRHHKEQMMQFLSEIEVI